VSARIDRQWAALAVAYATFVLVGVSAGVGGVLLPAQIADYGVDKAAIGLTFFTFSAGFFAAGSTSGLLLHRLSARAVLVLGGGCFIAAALYTSSRPPFAAFVAVQVLAGYGGGLLESVLNTYLTELPGSTTKLNLLHAFFGVGALIGPLLASVMLRVTAWTTVWLVLALAGVALTVCFWLFLPSAAAAAPGPAHDGEAATQRENLLLAAVRQPAVLLGAGFLAVYVGLEIGMGNWAFSYLTAGRGQGDLIAGYTVSGYWLGLTLGRFLISPVATRLRLTPVGLVFACLVGVAAATTLAWAGPTLVVTSAGLMLLGFFLGPIFPTTMSVVPSLTTPRLVPTAIGVINGFSVVGGSVLPWLAGVLGESIAVWTLLPFTLALGVAQLGLWWLVAQRVSVPEPAVAAVEAAAS
jgi:fucose permease